ncbi:MAG TPA: hypothetical protein VMT17_05845, partial [Anaeromyxobacteraceae bacterium]|nr:hypothetical protein [Anaeromyxobacteraceae bacterium]
SSWLRVLANHEVPRVSGARSSSSYPAEQAPSFTLRASFDPRDVEESQFFAALATDPLLLRADAWSYFDHPSYRATRIGLPLLAWIIAGGQEARAIWVYQLLCWLLSALLVWVVASWLEHEGHSPWWAASLALSAGVVSSSFSSLPDAGACTLMALALAIERRASGMTSPLLALSALVKETQLISSAAVAASDARDRRYWRAALHLAVPVVLVAAWRVYLSTRPGFGELSTNDNFGVPFAWVAEKLDAPLDLLEVVGLIGLALSFLAAVSLVPSFPKWTAATFAYVGFAAVALFLTRMVYVPNWYNYCRTLLPLPVLAVVLAERERVFWRRWLLRSVSLAWAALGVVIAYWWAAGLAAVLLLAWLVYRRAPSRPSLSGRAAV